MPILTFPCFLKSNYSKTDFLGLFSQVRNNQLMHQTYGILSHTVANINRNFHFCKFLGVFLLLESINYCSVDWKWNAPEFATALLGVSLRVSDSRLRMKYSSGSSHAGNVMFPRWECHVPNVGMFSKVLAKDGTDFADL